MATVVRGVKAASTADVVAAISAALAGGPAVFVTDSGELPNELPAAVDDGVAFIIQTSGSTGSPKRVMLPASAVIASADATRSVVGSAHWILALPTTYVAGVMVVVRSVRDGLGLTELPAGSFAAPLFRAAVSAAVDAGHDAVVASLVPAQLTRILDDIEADPAPWRDLMTGLRVLVGGQALSLADRVRAERLGVSVVRTYGSAETSGGVVYDGRAIGDARVDVRDGVVHIAGPTLATGYWGEPERTAQTFPVIDGVRWYRTQDHGSIVDGVLRVTGRVDDVIVTGGIKVSLGELESCLRELDPTAVATWFTDPTWGQVPAVMTETPLDEARARARVESVLSKAHRPYRFLSGPIPLLASGKPDRAAIHGMAERHGE